MKFQGIFVVHLVLKHEMKQTLVKRKCILCTNFHELACCPKLKEMKLKERIDFIWKKELCFECLGFGHFWNRCFARKRYDVCQLKHPTLSQDPARCGSKKKCSTQTLIDNPVTAPTADTINNRDESWVVQKNMQWVPWFYQNGCLTKKIQIVG